MLKKSIYIALVFIGLLFFVAIGEVFVDTSAQFEQTKSNIISLIQQGNFAEADVQTQKFIADFSRHKGIPQAVYDISYRYHDIHRDDKALQLHQYNVEHFPNDMYAMWSQVEITYYHIIDGNDTAVEAAYDKLLTVFSQQPTLPKEIYQVARMYNKFNRPDKALQLHQYNVEHSSKDNMYTMWSQVEIVYSHIRDGNDAAADAAFDKLLTVFSDQPTLPKEVCQVADAFRKAGSYDKADQLYQYVVDNWPLDVNSMRVQSYVIRANIALGNIEVAEAAAEKMIADYPSDGNIADAVYEEIAYRYYQVGQYEKAAKYFQKIVNDWPDYKYAWNAQCWIGECYWEMKKWGALPDSEANPQIKLAYQTLIEKYPDCSLAGHACLKLAHLSTEEGRQVDAAMYLEMFLQNSPDDPRVPDVLYDLGQIYEQMGQMDSAVEVYAEFIKVDPNNPLVKDLQKKFEELGG